MGGAKKRGPAAIGALLALGLCMAALGLYAVLTLAAPPDAPWIAEERAGYEGGPVIRVIQEGSPPVEEQIAVLAELGFAADQVDGGFFREQLYAQWDEETLLRYPYWLVFTALGMEYDSRDPSNYEAEINWRQPPLQREEIAHYSNSVFNFMRNYCYTPRHYEYILNQIGRLSGGQVVLENVRSGRVLGVGRLWVSFTLNGADYKFSVPGSAKRFNPEILTVVGELAGEDGEGRRLFWNGDEQGVHMVYCRRDTLVRLAERTGINFWGLDDSQAALW